MRLLFLLQDIPVPPSSGHRAKVHNLLLHLASRHECHVICFSPNANEHSATVCEGGLPGTKVLGVYPEQSGWRIRALQAAALVRPGQMPSAPRWRSREFANAISEALDHHDYDVVHLDMVNMCQYVGLLRGVPSVLSLNDSVSRFHELSAKLEARSMASRLVKRFLSLVTLRAERREFPRFDRIHVVSRQEKDHLKARAGLRNVAVIPIAVDDAYVQLPEAPVDNGPITIVAAGNLSVPSIREPLCDFLTTHWRTLREKWPSLPFVVLGGRSAPAAARELFSRLDGIIFHEWIESYTDLLSESRVGLFLDSRAGGMKTRVLEFLAAARPVVGSPAALEGIEGKDGEHFLVARDSEEALRHIELLARTPEMRRTMGEKARALVRELYTRQATGEAWERLYEELRRRR
jgi:glycosyltransferase involved in cell wall biosynthesis